MEFRTINDRKVPLGSGTGHTVSGQILVNPHSEKKANAEEKHMDDFQKKRLAFHLGKFAGKLHNAKTEHEINKAHGEAIKENEKRNFDKRIDDISDSDKTNEQKLREFQRLHFQNQKTMTPDQAHLIRQEIARLTRLVNKPMMTKEQHEQEVQKEKTERKIMKDKNPEPVTFASAEDEEPEEKPHEEPEPPEKDSSNLSEREITKKITDDAIKRQLNL